MFAGRCVEVLRAGNQWRRSSGFSGCVAFALLLAYAPAAWALSGEELLEKHRKALGGDANLSKVTGTVYSGRLVQTNTASSSTAASSTAASSTASSSTTQDAISRTFTWSALSPLMLREDSSAGGMSESFATDGRAVWHRGLNGVTWGDQSIEGEATRVLGLILARAYLTPDDTDLSLGTPELSADKKSVSVSLSGRKLDALGLTFDARSWLLREVKVQTLGGTVQLELEDYKKDKNVLHPMTVTRRIVWGDLSTSEVFTVDSVNSRAELAEELFERPLESPLSASIPAGTSRVSLPVTYDPKTSRLAIEASVQGSEPLWWFLDTSARYSRLEQSLVSTLNLVPAGSGRLSDEGALQPLFGVDKLLLGQAQLGMTAMMKADLSTLPTGLTGKVGGILGLDLFERLVVELRYSDKQVNLTLPAAYTDQGLAEALPMDSFGRVNALVNGQVLLSVVVNTFSPATVMLPAAVVAAEKLAPPEDRRMSFSQVGSSVPEGTPSGAYVGALQSLQLGQSVLPVILTVFPPPTDAARPDEEVELGQRVLERFNVTVDRPRRQILLEQGPRFKDPFPYDRSGLSFKSADSLEVVAIREGIETSLKVGDQILAVQTSSGWSPSKAVLMERLKEAAGTRLKLRIQAGKKTVERELTLRELL